MFKCSPFTFYESFTVVTEFWFLESVFLKLVLPSFSDFLSSRADDTLSFVQFLCYTFIVTDGFFLEIILGNLKSV